MFKFLLILSFCFSVGFSSEKETATKIVQTMVAALNTNNKPVWIQRNNKHIADLIDVTKFDTTYNCNNAGVIVLHTASSLDETCSNKPVVVLDYALLKKNPNAVAAFFWKKGRPNIVFIKARAEKFNIVLHPSYKIYLEETIW